MPFIRLRIGFRVLSTMVSLTVLFNSCNVFTEKDIQSKPVVYYEEILPFQDDHVHGSTIVEFPNKDLLAAWFQGSGERWADDVRIIGSRKKRGKANWTSPFVLADVRGLPDCNPVLFIDGKDRLWLMWITIIANQWETSLIKYRLSEDYLDGDYALDWVWQDELIVKAGSKTEQGIQPNDSFVASIKRQLEQYDVILKSSTGQGGSLERWEIFVASTLSKANGEDLVREGRIYQNDSSFVSTPLGYPYFRRMGWQTRNKPFITKTGRMIVPLYSDGFGFSIMAITDDWGGSWKYSEPIVGLGNIQPTLAQTRSGKLVAYMRDNGSAPKRIHVSHSADNGETWSVVQDTDLPNPRSACDIITLQNGDWVLIYNDTERERNRLAVALSEDEGQTWPWHKYIVNEEVPTQAHYPAIIVDRNGFLHLSYSYFKSDNEKSIQYCRFNEAWIKD